MSSTIKAVPFYSIALNGSTIRDYSPCVQIVQSTDNHTIAFVDVLYRGVGTANLKSSVAGSWTYWKERTPISITYGMSPTYLAQMLGYVASYKVIKTGKDSIYPNIVSTRVQYTIIGTSLTMQSTVNKAWKHISPSAIASKIAVNNGLRGVIHEYQAAIDYRLQNVSDFKFLEQLASEIGYRFYVDNTDLYFINPTSILGNTNVRNIPQFWMYGTPGLKDTLVNFQPVVGSITPDGGVVANRTLAGINPYTGLYINANQQYQLYEAFSDKITAPTISQNYAGGPADSYYEAQQKLSAETATNMFWITADASVVGDYRVKPNNLVQFIGQAVPQTELGFWLVQSATHNMTMPAPTGNQETGTYSIDMVIVRDQSYTTTVTTPSIYSPVMQNVPSKLVAGKWQSVNVGAQTYAT